MNMLLVSEKETDRFSHAITGHLGSISQARINDITYLGILDLSHGVCLTLGLQLSGSKSIANNLVPPRRNDVSISNGITVPIFAMSHVLVFVLWALVTATPRQDRGLQIHCSVPRHFSWGVSFHLASKKDDGRIK